MYQLACYRHPNREATIRCQRCERPICIECMTEAAVGFQCPGCVAEGNRKTRAHLGPYGGRRSADPAMTSKVLIGLNLAVWVACLATGGLAGWVASALAITPYGACVGEQGGEQIVTLVDQATCATLTGSSWLDGVATGAVWQVITSAFTHLEFWHIGFNMLALWFLGPQLESILGRTRFLALYLISAVTASCAVMWWSPVYAPTLGASGSIFGLMGAILVLAHKHGGDVRAILVWLGANAAITFLGGSAISWQGHLGGFIGGLLVVAAFAYAPRNQRNLGWLGASAVMVLSLVLILVRALQFI